MSKLIKEYEKAKSRYVNEISDFLEILAKKDKIPEVHLIKMGMMMAIMCSNAYIKTKYQNKRMFKPIKNNEKDN